MNRNKLRIFRLNKGKCERCGITERLTVHHLISQRIKQLRNDPENFVCLCRACHNWVERKPEGKEWCKTTYYYRISKLKLKLTPSALIDLWAIEGGLKPIP